MQKVDTHERSRHKQALKFPARFVTERNILTVKKGKHGTNSWKIDTRKSKVVPYGVMKQSTLVVKNEDTFSRHE